MKEWLGQSFDVSEDLALSSRKNRRRIAARRRRARNRRLASISQSSSSDDSDNDDREPPAFNGVAKFNGDTPPDVLISSALTGDDDEIGLNPYPDVEDEQLLQQARDDWDSMNRNSTRKGPSRATHPKGQPSMAKEERLKDLDWSLDPHHSDWTIEIICKEDNTSTLYNVHKIIMAVGPWKCDYFERLLAELDEKTQQGMDTRKKKNKENTHIRIKLHKVAADVFPQMLDYCYGAPTGKLDIDTNTATGLHALGVCFENKWLEWEAKQFYLNDMSVDNAHIYYRHASVLDDEDVLDAIRDVLCANFTSVNGDTDSIVRVAPAEFWLSVFDKKRQQEQEMTLPSNSNPEEEETAGGDVRAAIRKITSEAFQTTGKTKTAKNLNGKPFRVPPTLIADICYQHHRANTLTQDDLDTLTSEEMLPQIIVDCCKADSRRKNNSDGLDASKKLLMVCPILDIPLTSLQVRCLSNAPEELIAEVCESICSHMTLDSFEIVTCEEFLTTITPEMACRFIQIEAKFLKRGGLDSCKAKELTQLQQRCFKSFSEHWAALKDRHDYIIDFLHVQNPMFIKELCKATTGQLIALQTKLETTQSVLNKALLRERKMRQDYEAEITRLKGLHGSDSCYATRGGAIPPLSRGAIKSPRGSGRPHQSINRKENKTFAQFERR